MAQDQNNSNKLQQESEGEIPNKFLRLIIFFYFFVAILNLIRFVLGNVMYLHTGDIDQYSFLYLHEINSQVQSAIVGTGFGTMLLSGLLVLGLRKQKKGYLYLALIETGFHILIYGFLFVSFIHTLIRGYYLHMTLKIIGNQVIIKLIDFWGILFFGVLILIHLLKGYVLIRKDVRSLFN